ncbi:MAG: hypothetical protein KJP04_00655, partial [Arenicella sp.]|nr:hypothetical protein [Arenicella sp.]
AEEVSHMLFGSGYRSLLFATHPPLPKRIARIEKHFDENEIAKLAKKLKAQEQREHIQAEQAEREFAEGSGASNKEGIFNVEAMIDNIGNPEFERILAAAILAAELPSGLSSAARSLEWAPEILFYCLLDDDDQIRDKQMMAVLRHMGDISEAKLSHLVDANSPITPEQRLPLLEICFPALKRRPVAEIEKILAMINYLVTFDRTIDSFEYLLSRMVAQHLREANNPSASVLHGRKKLDDHAQDLSTVISIVASHGQPTDGGAGLQMAQRAFKAGMNAVDIHHTNLSFHDDWQQSLDKALQNLDRLRPEDKNQVVKALATTVADDKKLVSAEHEMMRVVCSLLHVPLPILRQAEN